MSLQKVIYLSKQQYNILRTSGTITVGNVTYTYNQDDLYFVPAEEVVVDAYQSSWWDSWGPTVIMLAGSALIVIFLFSRLSGAVGSSNRQAMDFSKSRARRVQDSKVRFKDVAGCDAEKAEMEEAIEKCTLPEQPDYEAVNKVLINARLKYYG